MLQRRSGAETCSNPLKVINNIAKGSFDLLTLTLTTNTLGRERVPVNLKTVNVRELE